MVSTWSPTGLIFMEKPGRVAAHCVQDVILETLPHGLPSVGGWVFPMAVQYGDATWSLPPAARSVVEVTDPSHLPDPEVHEADVENAQMPWVEGPVPEGLSPPPDMMPLLDYPVVYHGGVWFKGPFEVQPDGWIRRRRLGESRGRVPGIHVTTCPKMMVAEQKEAWDKYLAEYGEPPRIPPPDEVKAKELASPSHRTGPKPAVDVVPEPSVVPSEPSKLGSGQTEVGSARGGRLDQGVCACVGRGMGEWAGWGGRRGVQNAGAPTLSKRAAGPLATVSSQIAGREII